MKPALKGSPPNVFCIHRAAISLGSNLGDRFYNIEHALRMLEESDTLVEINTSTTELKNQQLVSVVDTSFMYESAPMYVTDQPAFINCACIIETTLTSHQLHALLTRVEKIVGRVPSFRNGPRTIDLDILTYNNDIVDTRAEYDRMTLDNLAGELVIPHPRMIEREFVLRPLNDMVPDYIHPVLHQPIRALLSRLRPSVGPPMKKVIPFPQYPLLMSLGTAFPCIPSTKTYWTSNTALPANTFIPSTSTKTRIMATLNTTPDSFSDGSVNDTIPAGLSYARAAIANGASILDIGGYSTRPGAAFVSIDEEIRRVVPVVHALRNNSDADSFNDHLKDLLISIDTFRPEVAKTAILAGANCINDVHAFTGADSYPLTDKGLGHLHKMRSVARELNVPVILMHSRGDAGQNKDYSRYAYAEKTVVEGVRVELGEKMNAIVRGRGGLRRWLVIVDPGIGFSKTLDGNLEVLRSAMEIISDVDIGEGSERCRNPLVGCPMMIGVSRKSFLGAILAEGGGRKTEPKERGWATAAAVACAVQQGAAVVRVHDVQEMVDVVNVSNAIWA